MAGFALEALAGAGRIADLYCGVGTFTFPLAQIAPVHAVDGDAPAIRALSAALATAPDARYRGAYRREDMAAIIAGVDWVVFPSEWWENAPLVINEALQHRRPVLCSALGGTLELVADGVNGLHFPVSDATALAEAMRRSIETPGLWDRLVAGIAPPIGIAESAARHLALYETLLATAAVRRAA